jgi:hypothetical protein
MKQKLMEGNRTHRPECLITMTLGSRQFGHRDNYLENFLRSFLEMTEKPGRVEILIKVDDDDDLLFFHHIKRKYLGKIDIRFLVSERGRGYADFHQYHESLLRLRSPSSRIWNLQSEDAVFVLSKWDSQMLSILADYPHDCFIGTNCPFEEAISIHGPFPVSPPVYWVRGDLFPVMGYGIIKCMGEVARKYPGWTSFGNSETVGGFAGDILRRLWERHQMKLHVQFPAFTEERGIVGWYANPDRHDRRTETNINFFLKENQKIRDEMVDAIHQYLNLTKNHWRLLLEFDTRPNNF